MNTKIIWSIVLIIAVIGVAAWLMSSKAGGSRGSNATTTPGVSTPLTDGTYDVDTERSVIRWTGTKTLVLDYEDRGTFSLSGGEIVVRGGAVADGDFVIDMTSLKAVSTSNTKAGIDALSTHLKSEDFFDVAAYPTATFAITKVEGGIITGDLTIKGVAKPVSFPATLAMDGNALTARGAFTLDRTDWGITWGSGTFFDDLGNNIIADEVGIELDLRAVPALQ